MPHQRADVVLVARGFFESRAKAQEAISAGLVFADGRPLRKASEAIPASAEIAAKKPYPWVSRSGMKLAAALDHFGFDASGLVCLDVGASTGGFTDVLLARGAAYVHAIDVGHGQFHAKFAADPRVDAREGLDARNLTADFFQQAPRLIVCDVSFISLTLILPAILPLAAREARLVALVKPQFEAGPGAVVKGIVKSEEARDQACEKISACVEAQGWTLSGLIPSPITGGDGNQEYLLGAALPPAGLNPR